MTFDPLMLCVCVGWGEEVEQEPHSGMKTEAQRATESLNVTQEFQTTYGFWRVAPWGVKVGDSYFYWAVESKRAGKKSHSSFGFSFSADTLTQSNPDCFWDIDSTSAESKVLTLLLLLLFILLLFNAVFYVSYYVYVCIFSCFSFLMIFN